MPRLSTDSYHPDYSSSLPIMIHAYQTDVTFSARHHYHFFIRLLMNIKGCILVPIKATA